MKVLRAQTSFILTAAVLLLCAVAIPAQTQVDVSPAPAADEGAAPSDEESHDHAFEEILLSPEGVTAFDTLGNRWVYSFALDQFIPGEEADRREGPESDEIVPVSERQMEEIKVKRFQSNILVGYNEFVDDDILATGRVTIRGWVKGNVQSFTRVVVTGTGQVDGDIRAPNIDIKDGAVVLGQISRTPIPEFSAAGIWVVFSFFLFFVIFTWIAVSLAPQQVRRVDSCIKRYRIRSLVMGFLLVILMGPIMAAFALTIVGLIVTILLPFAYLVAVGLGVISFSMAISRVLTGRILARPWSLMYQSFLGLLLFSLLWFLVAYLKGGANPTMQGFGTALLVIAILTTCYPGLTGLGATFLTRFGFSDYISYRDRTAPTGKSAPTPAPPPIPKAPQPSPPPPRHPGQADGPAPSSSGNE